MVRLCSNNHKSDMYLLVAGVQKLYIFVLLNIHFGP